MAAIDIMTLFYIWIGTLVAFVLFIFILWYYPRMYDIKTVVLRYQGDKRKPLLLWTRARKIKRKGITLLKVRGFRYPVRNFRSENYFPSDKTKNGALILWEIKDGVLVASVPKDEKEKRPKENPSSLVPAEWSHDEELYKRLALEAVDDNNLEWFFEQMARIDRQYIVGIKAFLREYGNMIVIIFIAILLLVGFIVWLKESPEMMAQCASAARQATESQIARAAETIRPPA